MLCFLSKLVLTFVHFAYTTVYTYGQKLPRIQTYFARPKSIADFEAALTRAESGGADVVQAECFRKSCYRLSQYQVSLE